ncbi:scavenger receptor cysteine-rich domain-containing protein DMBT1-like [Paroedura picta]|uniref:scavenger receptor cysteine-rich domain-containing protein DMBT1-like n=1 Tax=Paroedura picta TaxID=143630 RepID=UPI0040571168
MSNGIRRTVLIRCICKINQQTKKEETHIVDESDSSGKNQTPNEQIKIIFAFCQSFPQSSDLSYFVNVNQNTAIEVTLTAYSMYRVLFLHTCIASSEPNDDFKSKLHYMRKNGCTRDPNLTNYYSRKKRTIFFKFKPVTSDNKPIASMKCWIHVCYKNDYQSRCYQGCQNRRKRETSSDFEHVHILGSFNLE